MVGLATTLASLGVAGFIETQGDVAVAGAAHRATPPMARAHLLGYGVTVPALGSGSGLVTNSILSTFYKQGSL